jgi:hypothetical protein
VAETVYLPIRGDALGIVLCQQAAALGCSRIRGEVVQIPRTRVLCNQRLRISAET